MAEVVSMEEVEASMVAAVTAKRLVPLRIATQETIDRRPSNPAGRLCSLLVGGASRYACGTRGLRLTKNTY
jgi:hypothetical protein